MKITHSWTLPIRLDSSANLWEHWSKTHKRHKTYGKILIQIKPDIVCLTTPCEIMLTRIAPRYLDDDNLLFGFKFLRDELSSWILPDKARGQGDNIRHGLHFSYSQEKGAPKQYAIRIDVIV